MRGLDTGGHHREQDPGETNKGEAGNQQNRKHKDRKWGTENTQREIQNKTGNKKQETLRKQKSLSSSPKNTKRVQKPLLDWRRMAP